MNKILMNSKKFGLIIENSVKEKKISYMDAVVLYCEENNIDTGSINSLINKALKEKIQSEAEKKNLIQKSSTGVLPV
jgi:hypothetical protein